MRYELYYWPGIQGRGEFIRLALEEAGADYVDVARDGSKGMQEMLRLMNGDGAATPSFAPPFLKAGDQIIGQTANILLFLGPRLGLVAADEASRLWTHQLQLTIADLVTEVHDTHHPIAGGLYYKDQKPEALRRAADFTGARLPKFLAYFETILERNPHGDGYMVGNALSYVDLSMFQIVAGLHYAFPKAMKAMAANHPRLMALHERASLRPRIAAYLQSARRLPFNKQGIFRHYKELDAGSRKRQSVHEKHYGVPHERHEIDQYDVSIQRLSSENDFQLRISLTVSWFSCLSWTVAFSKITDKQAHRRSSTA